MTKQEFIKKTSREIFDIFTNREKKETVVQVLDKNLDALIKEAQREAYEAGHYEGTYLGSEPEDKLEFEDWYLMLGINNKIRKQDRF